MIYGIRLIQTHIELGWLGWKKTNRGYELWGIDCGKRAEFTDINEAYQKVYRWEYKDRICEVQEIEDEV